MIIGSGEITTSDTLEWSWRKARNGLIFGLSGGLIYGLIFGLSGGLSVGLGGGLSDFIRHFALRWVLYRSNYAPWHYVPFLNYAADCILLRSLGNRYIFFHRLLLEHFAEMNEPSEEA
jgi:hypothetical protein